MVSNVLLLYNHRGDGWERPLKTLACKYGPGLQKIGLECSGFSVSLQNIP